MGKGANNGGTKNTKESKNKGKSKGKELGINDEGFFDTLKKVKS